MRPTNALREALLGAFLLAIPCLAAAQAPLRPQPPSSALRGSPIRAVSYDVYASLFPTSNSLTAKTTVEFEARQPSRFLECELHPNLRLSAVRDASGQTLEVERDPNNSLLVRVTLPDDLAPGQRTKLTFEYSGILANADQSPVPGMILAHVAADGSYLLLPSRWFPLTDYPSNRYTGVFHIEVPQGFTVAGTGVTDGPQVASARVIGPQPVAPAGAGRVVYTFRVDTPEAAGTFVAGALQLSPIKAEGLTIPVYAPASAAGSMESYGDAAARIVSVFSDQFGPLPQPNLAIAQLPDGSLESYAAPGLLLVSQRVWGSAANEPVLADLVAAQWWGSRVMAASPADAWLTDGLSRYSEALYIEQSEGKGGMDKLIDQFAVGALMYEGSVAIADAGRLVPYSPDYNSVVVNKGAMVFHMLRGQIGDSNFLALLRDFYSQYAGKDATLADFEQLAKTRAERSSASSTAADTFVLKNDTSPQAPDALPPSAPRDNANLGPFFAQWLHSNGIPEFNLTYTIYRTRKGFRIVGKVEQNLDFFNMPVELEVRTEGNPELKTIQVTGQESSFETDVFGRPRPGGVILDPHNYILKSSPALRVRAIIARGEAMAEQGRFYEALQQYSQALTLDKNNSLAEFRTGEAFFYEKNYSAAANSFRDALDGDLDPINKWVEVWSHIYLGKIYDIAGDRTRAVNEYSKAQQTNDDTGGAQSEAKQGLQKPYTEGG